MRIAEIEVREFSHTLSDVGHRNGNIVYRPGEETERPGFVLTIRTADGEAGHYRGAAFTPPMVAQIGMVADALIGRDPLEREEIWADLWRRLRHTDHLGLGPIDIALWDLAGRHYDESVGSLLGGYRDPLPAYASTFYVDGQPDGLSTPEAFADYAEELSDRGFEGFKFHSHPAGDSETDVAICRALAERVPDMDLMIDVGSQYRTYAEALEVGRALDDLDFFWYEDPLMDTGQSAQMAKRLVRELDTPILGLEHVRSGPFGSVDHLAQEGLDFVRTSAHLDGGITGAMRTARAAEAFGLDAEFLLGGPAHLQCLSATRNTNYYELGLLHPEVDRLDDHGFVEGVQTAEDGEVAVPEGPGLGVEIDWDWVDEHRTGEQVYDGG